MTRPTDNQITEIERAINGGDYGRAKDMLSACKGGAVNEGAFIDAVWEALKADANDLRKQQRILKAFRAALEPAPDARQEGWNEAIEAAAQAVPQGWCQPETSHIEMDVVLGKGIQAAIRALAKKGPTNE